MRSVCDNELLSFALITYRKRFISYKKNINRFKTNGYETPKRIDKILNHFDRKIKGIPIFTVETKKEYLKGIREIFNEHYLLLNEPKISKKMAYISYQAAMRVSFGRKYKCLSYCDFMARGMLYYYR